MSNSEISEFLTHLPEKLLMPLKAHLEKVKIVHQSDIRDGFGTSEIPYALEKKYPNIAREWGWQCVFPASKRSIDPRSGVVKRFHLYESVIQKAVKKSILAAGICKHTGCHTFRHFPHPGRLIHEKRLKYSHCIIIARPQRYPNNKNPFLC